MAMNTGEMEAGRPWWKVCCAGCILLVFGFAVALFVVIHAITGPGIQHISALPENYPKDLVLFRIEDAASIRYLPGTNKGKMVDILAYPARWFSGASSTDAVSAGMEKYSDAMEGTDRVIVTWINLKTPREDVLRHYAELFKKTGMADRATSDEATGSIVDIAEREDAVMQIEVQDLPDIDGVDRIVVTVDYIPVK
jgi:hypothetical protein